MVPVSMSLSDLLSEFQGCGIFEIKYIKQTTRDRSIATREQQ